MEERKQREEKSVGAAILEGSFAEAFSSMTDPRMGRTREHLLFADAVRSHWGIENSVHWVLDIAFREDECRVRKDHAPQNLAVL